MYERFKFHESLEFTLIFFIMIVHTALKFLYCQSEKMKLDLHL